MGKALQADEDFKQLETLLPAELPLSLIEVVDGTAFSIKPCMIAINQSRWATEPCFAKVGPGRKVIIRGETKVAMGQVISLGFVSETSAVILSVKKTKVEEFKPGTMPNLAMDFSVGADRVAKFEKQEILLPTAAEDPDSEGVDIESELR